MILAASPDEAVLLEEHGRPPRALPADAPLFEGPGEGLERLAAPPAGPVVLVPRPLALARRQELASLLALEHNVRKLPLEKPEDAQGLVAGLPAAQRAWLLEDIMALAKALRALSGARVLLGSLYVTRADHCRKFHSDACGWRMLVTYAGPGTQWIADQEAGSREMPRRYERTLDEHNAAVIRAGGVRQAEAFDVVLLRGDVLSGGRGAIHRSPPVQAAGLGRLVLKLDAELDALIPRIARSQAARA